MSLGLTRFQELSRRHLLAEAMADCKSPIAPGDVVRVPLPIDRAILAEAVSLIEAKYWLRGFVNAEGQEDAAYQNVSLTFNPAIPGDPHHSTLGTASLSKRDFFYGNARTASAVGSMRDSYYDTYGFRKLTPAAGVELSMLTCRLKRSLVRSRLSIIRAGRPGPSNFMWGWHKDEPVFENLRINIHVTDSQSHQIQIMREDRMPASREDQALAQHCFMAGFCYSWDTHMPHRACTVLPAENDRAAIVLGVSPWFDLDEENDEWVPNEFFGKKHPLQMLIDGDVI
jgi:hypothetical protein